MTIKFFTISVCFLLIVLNGACTDQTEPRVLNSTRLQHTTVTPHLEEELATGNNVLYCATFQLAWNMMQDEIIKGEVILETMPYSAKILNKQLQTKNDLSESSYIAMAGELTNEFLERLNKTLQDKFGEQIRPEIKSMENTQENKFIAYAYLYKNLIFPRQFESLKETILFQGDKQEIQAFGLKAFSYSKKEHYELGKQVSILDYVDDNNFIVKLTSKSGNDEIVLAKIQPKKTLLKTVATVVQRLRVAKPTSITEGETLQIPKIDFDVTRSFSELEGKQILNRGWKGWFTEKAFQEIRFKLTEKGALLKSGSIFSTMKSEGPPAAEKKRNFIFDKPFLIYLKQKNGHHPYLVIWIDNVELLLKKK